MKSPLDVFTEVEAIGGRAHDVMSGLTRSVRQPEFVDAAEGQVERLRERDPVAVGAGSVGQNGLDSIARQSPRSVRIIDHGRVKAASVLTHPIPPSEIGRSKAVVAGERFKAVSPSTRVYVYDGSLQSLPNAALAGASELLVYTDNLAAEIESSQRAVRLGTPLLQASVHGPTLTCDLRSFENRESGQPHLCCHYQESDWEDLDRRTRFSCDSGSERGAAPLASGIATLSPAVLCATAAQLNVLEWVRRGLMGPSGDAWEIQLCGYTMKLVRCEIAARADCRGSHERWTVCPHEGSLADATLSELVAGAGAGGADVRRLSIEVEGYTYAGMGICPCTPHRSIGRFVRVGGKSERCHRGHELTAHPLYAWQQAPGGALASKLDRTLRELGAGGASSAIVRWEERISLIHAPLGPFERVVRPATTRHATTRHAETRRGVPR